MTIDPNKEYTAIIDTTYGKITVQLLPKEAPITVNNFVFLAREGFYNGLKIHRVVKGFVFQAGDPRGDGTGGPGYQFQDEPVVGDYLPGTVAMANSGPNTNGSQFFVTDAPTPHLNQHHTIFGEVVSGLDVVRSIAHAPTGPQDRPATPVVINSVTIARR